MRQRPRRPPGVAGTRGRYRHAGVREGPALCAVKPTGRAKTPVRMMRQTGVGCEVQYLRARCSAPRIYLDLKGTSPVPSRSATPGIPGGVMLCCTLLRLLRQPPLGHFLQSESRNSAPPEFRARAGLRAAVVGGRPGCVARLHADAFVSSETTPACAGPRLRMTRPAGRRDARNGEPPTMACRLPARRGGQRPGGSRRVMFGNARPCARHRLAPRRASPYRRPTRLCGLRPRPLLRATSARSSA